MTADEIRQQAGRFGGHDERHDTDTGGIARASVRVLFEIAAQLAELNQNLKALPPTSKLRLPEK